MRRWLVAGIVVLGVAAAVLAWWRREPAEAANWPERALERGNLLLVTMDTLRADRLNQTAMPRLTAFAGSAHRFDTAYAHAPLTLPSHASIMSGLLPPAHGVRGNGAFRLGDSTRTLAERLSDAGYRTGAFVGAFVLDARFGLAQGFNVYDGVDDDREFAADFAFAERRAPDVIARADRWIRETDSTQPWFAWVHLFDAHAPYDAPESAGLSPYDDEVHYLDSTLGAWLERLGGAGALSRTMVLITADHGEGLGEHGETSHGLFVYDSTMRVPLLVSGPGMGSGRHQSVAEHIDIVPTVLDTLGLAPDPSLPGRSLRLPPPQTPRTVHLEAMDGWLTAGAVPVAAVVSDGFKYIDLPEAELYDLAQDPQELTNVVDRAPERAASLAQAVRSAAPGVSSQAPGDAEAQARLRSLGYASGGARTPARAFTAEDDPKRVRPIYERFFELLASRPPDVDALRALVHERPQFDAARLTAASVLIESGRASEAVALLEPAAAEPGASQAILERLGAAQLAAGHPDLAVAVLEPVVSRSLASADAWNGLGVARAALGQFTAAQAAFDEATRLAPGSARIQFNRVLAVLQSGDRAEAGRRVAAFTEAHPESADGWRLAGTLRHEAGDAAGAVGAWRRVLALDPSDMDTLFNLAVTLADLGRGDEAREAARRFVARAPRPKYDREIGVLRPLADR